MLKKLNVIKRLDIIESENKELLWAKRFEDLKPSIPWLADTSDLTPNRWTVGYNYMYALVKVFEKLRPTKILDIGMGLSSKLIAKYLNYYNPEEAEHLILENNNSLKLAVPPSKYSKIVPQELTKKKFKLCKYFAYKDIGKDILGKQFDFISIDGPFGLSKHSRRDILEFLPDCLSDTFVIIVDDVDRVGEKNTVVEIEKILIKNNIKYDSTLIEGATSCRVIASKNLMSYFLV